MNKRVSIIFVVLGFVLLSVGAFLYFEADKGNTDNIKIMIPPTNKEKKEINEYLNSRYGEDFNVIEHTTSFCVVQNSEKDTYEFDFKCENNEIIDDIYKVEDSNGITFYVKKVTVKDDVKLIESLEKSHSNDYYDNYISYISANNYGKSISGMFETIGPVSSIEIINGFGLEKPTVEMDGDKYISYYIYGELNEEHVKSANKYMELTDYINSIRKIPNFNNIDLKVKINKDIDGESFKQYVTVLKDNDLLSLPHGIMANSIVFEFNNGYYLKYTSDFKVSVYSKYDYINEKNNILAYPNTIVFYFMTGDNIIVYNDFIQLDNSSFNFNRGE